MIDPEMYAFIGLATIITITPGADTMLVLRNALRRRARGAWRSPRDGAPVTGRRGGRRVVATRTGAALAALVVSLLPAFPLEGFELRRSVTGGALVRGSSSSFRIGATLGEAGVVGRTTSASFIVIEGFWWPGALVPVGIAGVEIRAPFPPSLAHGVPNPFGTSTVLHYHVPARSEVALSVFDVSGRHVVTLVNGMLEPGDHRVGWDGRDDAGRPLASGVYYARLVAAGSTRTRPILLVR